MAGSLVSQPYLVYGDSIMSSEALIDELMTVADLLYNENEQLGVIKWKTIIPELEKELSHIADQKKLSDMLSKGLVPAMEAMKNNDLTLLADIIIFEIVELLWEEK